ncbi:MAG: hypothetical protein IJY48_02375, partial [Mailhella sp.]|nr:hypothetical protein [Mailhella sp.]
MLLSCELGTRKKLRPETKPELSEPELFIRRSFYFSGNCASSGIAATGLIKQINSIALTQKDVLKTLSAV